MNETTGIAGIFSHPSSLQPELLRNVNILGHGAWGMGDWAWGMGDWAWGIGKIKCSPVVPSP
ncbi:hypothetical protein [Microcoleus sp. FACHB-68]|uniref:hypothetical protein n=1 Tax=Microcoleus sp. FACHB-68 TaxID=2692826 RepID=UPI0016888C90|nr:hypothetical protein [Microcoleus sp. FACHB-68]MBD1938573.1 hypothetical protein [Microcoleus sp. FACHB-68]